MGKSIFLTSIALSFALSAFAQAPAPASDSGTTPTPAKPLQYVDENGFTYTYPANWTEVDTKPMMPAMHMSVEDKASSSMEKKGAACTNIPLMLRNEELKAQIIVLSMPYSCVGDAVKNTTLSAIASGIAEGLQKGLNIVDPHYEAYKLGTHEMWIVRSLAAPKTMPEHMLSQETACTLLKSALVCWMGFAATPDGLHTMEEGQVTLDGEKPFALVPATVFKKK